MNKIFDYYNLDITVTAVNLALSKRCPIGWTLRMTERPCYGLVYIFSGEAEYEFPDRVIAAKQDDIIYFKKNESYITRALGKTNLSYCVISFEMEPDEEAARLPFQTVNTALHPLKFRELFHTIEELYVAKNIGYKLLTKSMLSALIYELLQEACYQALGKSRSPLGFRAVLDYIENNVDRKISVDVLANISGYSPSHFRRKFGELYGVSPVEYINLLRVEKAKDLLRSQLYSIHEIARLCGFDNVYYFSRVFKKFTNCTPGDYS